MCVWKQAAKNLWPAASDDQHVRC